MSGTRLTRDQREAARAAVMDVMGWEDDRYGVAVDYQGICWNLAGEIAQAVIEAVDTTPTATPVQP